jgi:2',3'-cyclic-nucleotide 2'-phosphodiesterase (5'-nucleotidase family)
MILAVVMVFGMSFSTYAVEASKEISITIIGTSDMHGDLMGWSYEDGKDLGKGGFARAASVVKEARAQNPNTLVIDNGDSIQGTILTDDLFNVDLTKQNPVMAVMNTIGYDAMSLGNHEFNFGTPLIDKLVKEANFPILSANIYKKGTTNYFVQPYTIKEVEGVKVGIIGLTVPDILKYDGTKQGVASLEYRHMAQEAKKAVAALRKEGVDVIIAAAHAGLDDRGGEDDAGAARAVAQACPEIDILLVGHDHVTLVEEINGVLVAAPTTQTQAVRFELTINKKGEGYAVTSKTATIVELSEYPIDTDAAKTIASFHDETLKFLQGTIGTATGDFHPAQIKGVPTAQIQDTPVIDLINNVQLAVTGADVSAAALFSANSNLPQGALSYANVFNIYKYPNTLVGVEVTGKELKAFMEWSASYYNTYQEGDLTVSFNPNIRIYAYDMFQGVDYDIDISKPAGSRITNLMFKGEPLADDTVLKLAINDYRYSGIGPTGLKLISNSEPYFESTPVTLRAAIRDYIAKKGTLTAKVDNNWKIIGTNWDEELHAIAVKAVNEGVLTIPKSADGRTDNVRSITEADLIKANLHPKYTGYMAIVHTNDTHGRIKEGDGVGFARISTFVNTLRADYGKENVLLLDAGDTLHGLPLVTATKGESALKVLEAMQYDAFVPGNHDFNYGQERLVEIANEASFPVLAANVTKQNGESLLEPYVIKEVAGKKIGIFGLATAETVFKSHPNNTVGLTFEDNVTIAKQMVEKLSGQVDMIIGLVHLGVEGDFTSIEVAREVDGIDLLVDGHSHTVLKNGQLEGDTLIVQAGEYDKYIGKVNVYFKADGSFDIKASLVDVVTGRVIAADPAITELIAEVEAKFDAETAMVLGKTPVKLDGERADVRTGETNLGNLVTNAMMYVSGADVALTNGGGIRASIAAGDITKKDAITVLPFGNIVVTIDVTGQDILDALEVGVGAYPEASGGFAHVAGMSYTFDATKEKGSRITSVLVNGKPINPTKTYSLATNDFTASGGDSYTMFAKYTTTGQYMALDEALIKYLQDKGLENTEVSGRVIEVNEVEVPDAA